METNKEKGERLKRLLDKVGLSQKEFSEKIGMSFSTVRKWAGGFNGAPEIAFSYLEQYKELIAMREEFKTLEKELDEAIKTLELL